MSTTTLIVRVRVTDISEEGPVSILSFPPTMKKEEVSSSETLLPVLT